MNTWITVVNHWGDEFVRQAGLMALQVGVLIGLLWLLDQWLCGRVRSSVRYGLWMLVLVKLVLSPYLSLPTGIGHWIHWQTEEPAVHVTESFGNPVSPLTQTYPTVSIPVERDPIPQTMVNDQPMEAMPALSLTWKGMLLVGWLTGILILALGLLIRALSLHRLIQSGETACDKVINVLRSSQQDMKMTQSIELCLTHGLDSPAVCRAWRPIILLPKVLADQFPEDKLRAVLLHELCHIKRADLWINWAQTLVQVFYFYNPLVWWANTYIRRLREQAVDEGVLVCLQGCRQCYSHTLIDIAEVVTLRPKLGIGLIGVAESKTRLNERIKLMLNTPIPKKAKLGTLGLALIVALGMVLLPMAAAQGPAHMPKAGTLKPVDAQTRNDIATKIHAIAESMLSSYEQGDLSAYLSHFTENSIGLPQEHEALVGKGALHKSLVEEQNKGLKAHGFKAEAPHMWMSGDMLYEVNLYAISLSTPGIPGVITDFRNGLTIWQRQPDGSFKIQVDAYNRAPVPEKPMDFGTDTSLEDAVVQGYADTPIDGEAQEALFDEIRQIEASFHQLFLDKNASKATDHYTDDATLMVMGRPVFQGKAAIAKVIEKGIRETPLTALRRDIIQIDGDANMIYVVNLFQWTMKDPATGDKFSIPGKGVHVWQHQPDGSWKILIDINNTDVPLGS